ncbi:MAG: Holliday junction branch migration protein RuvA [Muribaculaceae bacterium]|nr:Holliday junction branch migration protein RuvA [Muribaculaceae bacterium]
MIEYVSGRLVALTPTDAVIDVHGIGYQLCISLATYAKLEGATETKLLVHEAIREDAHTLYGFADERERRLFRELIGVSGVGAGTARVILSSIQVPELEQIIVSGDYGRLKAVKGIGAKTAQRIIVDLKDKIKSMDDTLLIQPTVESEVFDEALTALTILGYARPQAQKVLKKLFDSDPGIKLEVAIKKALAML